MPPPPPPACTAFVCGNCVSEQTRFFCGACATRLARQNRERMRAVFARLAPLRDELSARLRCLHARCAPPLPLLVCAEASADSAWQHASRTQTQRFQLQARADAVRECDARLVVLAGQRRAEAAGALEAGRARLRQLREQIRARRAALVECLLGQLYEVKRVESNVCTIAGCRLPDDCYDLHASVRGAAAEHIHEVNAALGYVVFVVDKLSHYLAVPLPYAMAFRGSCSTISSASQQREVQLSVCNDGHSCARADLDNGVAWLDRNVRALSMHLDTLPMRSFHLLPNLLLLLTHRHTRHQHQQWSPHPAHQRPDIQRDLSNNSSGDLASFVLLSDIEAAQQL